ncbi:peptide chain release factor family protein [Commensalibacter communis]|uniref:peptide chain release factor family protein n=1 Tax=Commensalibacter communis TaxID=2972786 RepID=UPI0038D10140
MKLLTQAQHVNKIENAVHLLHIPMGIAVFAQKERSQFRNKALAKVRLFEQIQSIN